MTRIIRNITERLIYSGIYLQCVDRIGLLRAKCFISFMYTYVWIKKSVCFFSDRGKKSTSLSTRACKGFEFLCFIIHTSQFFSERVRSEPFIE